mgnify:CR=1 FL=1
MKASGLGVIFFFQAEDGIRYLVRSRGLGDVYKRQALVEVDEVVETPARQVALEIVGEDVEAALDIDRTLSLIHI